MFERLVGLETEYALRFRPHTPGARNVSNGVLFNRLVEFLKTKTPLVPAITADMERTYFTGYGGAVRFERLPFFAWLPAAGLVEGATPECRGPRQLLRYQRAQDVLLSRAAVASGGDDGQAALLKNNRDGGGSTYGSHENYEATIASGPGLWLWRCGMAILLPLSILPLLVTEVLCWALLVLLYPLILLCGGRSRRPAPFLERTLRRIIAIVAFPAFAGVELFARLVAFRRTRRELLAFLVSRPIIAGAGMVDERGRFSLSPRAAVVSTECTSGTQISKAIFYLGHVWKGLWGLLAGDWPTFTRLFAPRQRLQIIGGDANVAQVAEYLKIGTTLLVLDAIEAGLLRDAPLPRSPVLALRGICADPTLRAQVPLADGRRWTALQMQRFYLAVCRRHVAEARAANGQACAEAAEILDLWQQTLDTLEDDPRQLVGKLDWVTKRHLLEANAELSPPGAESDAKVAARRKLDLRYHELSQEGYFLRLEGAGLAPTIIEPEDVLSAIEAAPEGTPAALRGQLIRTSAANGQEARASWSTVIIGSGKTQRVVRLLDKK